MEQNVNPNSALNKDQILLRLETDLFIRPLLEPDKQINEVSIDLRLGYNFLVSIQGREAFINASLNEDLGSNQRNIYQFFQPTRRELGETFILHPHQTILGVTLEYVKLPPDLMMMLFMRSSYARLGLTISTIVQPGYCGCLSIELTNNGSTAINLTVGSRIIQALLLPTSRANYFSQSRKYICQVRPEASAAVNDTDLVNLNKLWKQDNNR